MPTTETDDLEAQIPGAFTEADMEKFSALWEKKWVRVDPVTQKPHALNKDFFWKVVGQYPASKAGENMNAPVMHFEVQRYWRNKFYHARLDPMAADGPANRAKRNMPWSSKTYDGELIPGTCQISYPEFLKQFKEDQ